nr:hypothetical protein [Tanacetum cinerariifolium]
MPEPIYPWYIPLEDEHILSAEEQPLPPIVSPIAESPGYVAELDPEEDPEEYEDDETEDGPVDYPMDRGDDGDDDDGDSSGDDADDEDEDEEDKEEDEHLASADFAVVIPTDELVSPHEGTKPFIPPPSIDTATTGARITVRLQAAISFPPEVEVERLLAMPTPSLSPLTSLSPPSAGERLARCMAPTALPSPPLPLPLHMPPPIDRRDDIPETKMPPRKRLCLSTLRFRRRGIGDVGYGIKDTWIDPTEAVLEMAHMTIGEDSHIPTSRCGLVVGLLIEDMIAHQETIQIVEDEAYAAPEAWALSIGLSQAVHSELQTHQEQVQTMAPVTRKGPSTFPNNANLNNMTPKFVQAMINQALLRNSTNGNGSHNLHEDNQRNVQTARPCFYADFMKYAALTWWNSQIRSLGLDAYSMTWDVLKKKMTDKYYPQGEIKKLEMELWNLKFVADETEKINKYVSGLPDNIYGSVKASKPKTLDETIEFANDLMDQKLRTYAERQSNNKRKANESFKNNHGYQQQTPKRQNVTRVYNMGTCERKPYSGNLPKNNGENPKRNGCFECEATWHFKRDCTKLKNKDWEKVNAPGWVYAVENAKKRGNASREPDSNIVMGTFLLNNCYGSILFDTGADRSFISTMFSSLINIVLTPLGNSYDVELAD